jgi:hypothetical protein
MRVEPTSKTAPPHASNKKSSTTACHASCGGNHKRHAHCTALQISQQNPVCQCSLRLVTSFCRPDVRPDVRQNNRPFPEVCIWTLNILTRVAQLQLALNTPAVTASLHYAAPGYRAVLCYTAA